MKATQRDFVRVAPKAASEARIFFFCGPDEAGAHGAATRIHSLLNDPGERIELAGADLRKDPVRLGDEARSGSLFGETRHIYVRAQGDEAHDAVANLLEGEVEPCPVLIVAMGATDKSRTAKLLVKRSDALVAMFYPPDLKDVTNAIRGVAGGMGLTIGTDVAERIATSSGLDSRLARSEVEKLALYLDASIESPRPAGLDDLAAIGASSEDAGFAPLVDAVLGGDARNIAGELQRMRDLGLNPVGLLLAFERRTAQLAALAARLDSRGNIEALLSAEVAAHRVFYQDRAALKGQLRTWRGKRLQRLVEKLAGLHQDLLGNSQDAELLMRQGLAEIARVAIRFS